MENAGLTTDEGLEQVRWLVECRMVDFVEISGGNAENKTSKLHSEFLNVLRWFKLVTDCMLSDSFGAETMEKAPKIKESTRIREAYFTEFAERVQHLSKKGCPIQLGGGKYSVTYVHLVQRLSLHRLPLSKWHGWCHRLWRLWPHRPRKIGRAQPELPREVLLNPSIPDDEAFGMSHIVKGQLFARMIPVKVVGAGLAI
jgi:hypothetical protein